MSKRPKKKSARLRRAMGQAFKKYAKWARSHPKAQASQAQERYKAVNRAQHAFSQSLREELKGG